MSKISISQIYDLNLLTLNHTNKNFICDLKIEWINDYEIKIHKDLICVLNKDISKIFKLPNDYSIDLTQPNANFYVSDYLNGTVSVDTLDRFYLIGNNTTFTTTFVIGDIIRFFDGVSYQVRKIVEIISDTSLKVNTQYSIEITGSYQYTNGYTYANTWYGIWLVVNPENYNDYKFVLETRWNQETFLSQGIYTDKKRIGSIFLNTYSKILPFWTPTLIEETKLKMVWDLDISDKTAFYGDGNILTTTYQPINLYPFCPPTTLYVDMSMELVATDETMLRRMYISKDGIKDHDFLTIRSSKGASSKNVQLECLFENNIENRVYIKRNFLDSHLSDVDFRYVLFNYIEELD